MRAALLIPLGVAASPDPTILPVLLSASTLSLLAAIESMAMYVVVTVLAMTALSVGATVGGYQIQWPWLERNADTITAAVLVGVGVVAWVSW